MKWFVPIMAWVAAASATVGTAVAFGNDGRGTVLLIGAVMAVGATATSGAVAGSDRPTASAVDG